MLRNSALLVVYIRHPWNMLQWSIVLIEESNTSHIAHGWNKCVPILQSKEWVLEFIQTTHADIRNRSRSQLSLNTFLNPKPIIFIVMLVAWAGEAVFDATTFFLLFLKVWKMRKHAKSPMLNVLMRDGEWHLTDPTFRANTSTGSLYFMWATSLDICVIIHTDKAHAP